MSFGSDTERAWAAGFFDGEGSSWASRDGYHITVTVSQAGEGGQKIIERFYNAVGVGVMYGPLRPTGAGKKEHFRFQAKGQFDAQEVMDSMWPWLSDVKREQYTRAVDFWKSQPYKRQKKRRAVVLFQ